MNHYKNNNIKNRVPLDLSTKPISICVNKKGTLTNQRHLVVETEHSINLRKGSLSLDKIIALRKPSTHKCMYFYRNVSEKVVKQ